MEKEVVVVLRPDPSGASEFSTESPSTTDSGVELARVLDRFGATMRPMFDLPDAAVEGGALGAPAPDEAAILTEQMARYYAVEVEGQNADALADALRSSPVVETAYVKPPTENPIAPQTSEAGRSLPERVPIVSTFARGTTLRVSTAAAAPARPAPRIPDYRGHQGYLNAAPAGVDVAFAWPLPGGRGQDVRVIDIEGGWCFTHVDLRATTGGLLGGTAYSGAGWRNHGTAVLGEIGGHDNNLGIVGIAPDAKVSAVSHNLPRGSAHAIELASSLLRPGDILLLEMHRAGPRHGFTTRNDQLGYIAVEWWPDDFLAIQLAIVRGVIVVEAAGNGAEDLDDAIYETPAPHFPTTWKNPFRTAADSGAIVVGAGAPPPGTHGRNHGPDRSRLDFSNFGSRVDCQGWGREVTTTGYGDLFGGTLVEDYWFTDIFSGTSSASPIVTGVVACLQGISKARGGLLTPSAARSLLRSNGSSQTAAPGRPISQRIGKRPDLRILIPAMAAPGPVAVAARRTSRRPRTQRR